ncbi:MAG TPA: acyl-CoA dehydrogenase family protein [Nocardioidaceae bacterium]
MSAPVASVHEAAARAREVAEKIAAPRAEETDSGVWPEEAVRALQASLGGLVVPREDGGAGLGLRALVGVCETLGEACASTAICFGMHNVAAAVIAAKPTDRQRKEFLRPIAAGEHLTTLALSEPGTGAQFWLPQTRLTSDGDLGWRVNGEKSFVTNGSQADSYVVSTVAADPDAPLGEFSNVVVWADSPGLTWHGAWEGIGMRGNSSRAARLDDVPVGPDALLGGPGDQIWYVFEVVAPYFLTAMAGTYLGVAQAALTEAVEHLKRRRHSHTGRSIAGEPVLQHRLGVLWSQLQATRRLVHWAAEEADSGGREALPALTAAKAQVADTAVLVTNEAMTLVGGIGYRDRHPVERHLRDARAAHVMSPTTDILRTWTGRALLDVPLLGT